MNRRLLTACVMGMSLGTLAHAKEGFVLKHPAEQQAWDQIQARFVGKPELMKDRNGKVTGFQIKGLKKDTKHNGWASVKIDPKTGHVTMVSGDRAGFTNEEFKIFSAFTELNALVLWHNYNYFDRTVDATLFDATGLAHMKDCKKLSNITLAGGGFDDAGMAEAAKFPALTKLRIWHIPMSDKGIGYLENHPTLEHIRVGPSWAKKMTNKTIETLATCPKLTYLGIGETYLTYEGGLEHLKKAKDHLKELDLGNCLITPEDVEKIKADLPNTKVKWEGLAAAGKVLAGRKWLLNKAKPWMPPELLEKSLALASQSKAERNGKASTK